MTPKDLIQKIIAVPFNGSTTEETARNAFLAKFPESRIATLSILEYNGGKSNDSFCYNLEFVKELPFGIGGRNNQKFGKNSSVQSLVQGIASMISDARNGNVIDLQVRHGLSGVDQDVLIKILSIYLPDKFLTIGQEYTLTLLGKILNIPGSTTDRIALNYKCNEELRKLEPAFVSYDYNRLGAALWQILSPANKAGFEKWLQTNLAKGSGARYAYITCMELLSYFYSENYYATGITLPELNTLYQDAIANQQNSNGKYYSNRSSSYGNKYYYSSAIQQYINFIQSSGTTVSTVSTSSSAGSPAPASGPIIPRRFYPKNQILFGPPGTGKTYNTIRYAVSIIKGYDVDAITGNDMDLGGITVKEYFDDCLKKNQIRFTTFHQSLSYEDFIEGIKPVYDEADKVLKYPVLPGVFKQICESAREDPEKNFVLIIDEINRGNVAQIFGELITLIEEDKREGEDNAIPVTLPYSSVADSTAPKFTVPANLYILGTMNTADRSVEALDSALRRRFTFIEMMPDVSLVPDSITGATFSPRKVLEKMNRRIEVLKDSEHQIGHSYLMNVGDVEKMMEVFRYKIIPLLQEYFFGDLVRIKMVIGEGFFTTPENTKSLFPKDYDVDYPESINRLWGAKEWADCEKDPTHSAFLDAIDTLMK